LAKIVIKLHILPRQKCGKPTIEELAYWKIKYVTLIIENIYIKLILIHKIFFYLFLINFVYVPP
jgi:hypothetical protein